jgi:hypothetical protein
MIQVLPGSAPFRPRSKPKHKRQAIQPPASYLVVSTPGVYQTTDCHGADIFTLANFQLTSGGLIVSTFPGAIAQGFGVSNAVLPIRTAWYINAGFLVWQNGEFVGNRAYYCELGSGEVFLLFEGQTSADYPTDQDCDAVSLIAVDGVFFPCLLSPSFLYPCLLSSFLPCSLPLLFLSALNLPPFPHHHSHP